MNALLRPGYSLGENIKLNEMKKLLGFFYSKNMVKYEAFLWVPKECPG